MDYGINPDTGKKIIQVLGKKSLAPNVPKEKMLELPCGKCIDCRLAYSRMWAVRCMMEAQYHKQSWFLTLTYDEAHVPRNIAADGKSESLTLAKVDFQNFMKRLRKNTGQKLRFFGCGEYGSSTFRPHYHIIVFGLELPPDDLKLYSKSKLGHGLYTSDIVSKSWKFGLVLLGEVNYETCAYTARYVMKKADHDYSKFYKLMRIEPEFVLMSRKPGIAREFYEAHPNIYEYEHIPIPGGEKGISVRPPRYFDKLLEADDPDFFAEVKNNRRETAEIIQQSEGWNTDLDYYDYQNVKAANEDSRLKVYKRSDF